jgi:hypothetical protein
MCASPICSISSCSWSPWTSTFEHRDVRRHLKMMTPSQHENAVQTPQEKKGVNWINQEVTWRIYLPCGYHDRKNGLEQPCNVVYRTCNSQTRNIFKPWEYRKIKLCMESVLNLLGGSSHLVSGK